MSEPTDADYQMAQQLWNDLKYDDDPVAELARALVLVRERCAKKLDDCRHSHHCPQADMTQLFNVPVPDWAAGLWATDPLQFRRIYHPHTGYAWQHLNMPLYVLCSARVEADGKRWMHVSCSRRNRLPSWEELRLVKDAFIGRDRVAVQILPKLDEHVNVHSFALHLWSCLDGDGLPDFRIDGTI